MKNIVSFLVFIFISLSGFSQKCDTTLGKEQLDHLIYLSKIYPLGLTESVKKEKDKTITTLVIVSEVNSCAEEYKQVVYSWGATYYFHNGKQCTKEIFEMARKNQHR